VLATDDASLPWLVVDASGCLIEPVRAFLRVATHVAEPAARGQGPGMQRGEHGGGQGRQARRICASDDQSRVECDPRVLRLHLERGNGPVVNPVPKRRDRAGQRPHAHRNPMEPWQPAWRAPLRQRLPQVTPRALTDDSFARFFAVLASDRDRALIATAVSSGARAAELARHAGRAPRCRSATNRFGWQGRPAADVGAGIPDAFTWIAAYLPVCRR
jgi:hypothetical protein